MRPLIKLVFVLCLLLSAMPGYGKLKILTTTTNLKSLVESVGGDKVYVESLSKGTQDPHYLEAKPSFMLKSSKADLLVSVGLGLEVGWLPLILRGARNPKLLPSQKGSFVAGEFIETMEVPKGEVSRAQGDVHPEGNPHFLLDPVNALKIGNKLKEKLGELDPKNLKTYESNYKDFANKLNSKIPLWKKRVSQGLKVITYHKTLTYFYHRFGVENVALLEPKPGVPPSASHILGVMKKAKEEGVKLALVENYFDPSVARRVAKSVSGLKVEVVPVSVGGEKGISGLLDLYERLVKALEGNP